MRADTVQVWNLEEFYAVLGLQPVPIERLRRGQINRIPRQGHNGKDDAGYVRVFHDGCLWGGNYAMGPDIHAYFNPNKRQHVPAAELARIRQRDAMLRAEEAVRTLRKQDDAAKIAQAIWNSVKAYSPHPYMIKKHLSGEDLPFLGIMDASPLRRLLGYLPKVGEGEDERMRGEILIVPMWGQHESGLFILRNIQMIDEDGNKRYLPGAQKNGCFWSNHVLAPTHREIGIAEGVATAISIAVHGEDWDGPAPVIAAMDAGNLPIIARTIQRIYTEQDICIYGDWDASGTGQEAARRAASQTRSGVCCFPPIDDEITRKFQEITGSDKRPSDFNDYFIATGEI